MSASGNVSLNTPTRRNHERRDLDVDSTIAEANRLLTVAGIERSPSWVSRQVRAFARTPMTLPFAVWLVARLALTAEQRSALDQADPTLAGRTPYADPTGDAAVRNVLRAS